MARGSAASPRAGGLPLPGPPRPARRLPQSREPVGPGVELAVISVLAGLGTKRTEVNQLCPPLQQLGRRACWGGGGREQGGSAESLVAGSHPRSCTLCLFRVCHKQQPLCRSPGRLTEFFPSMTSLHQAPSSARGRLEYLLVKRTLRFQAPRSGLTCPRPSQLARGRTQKRFLAYYSLSGMEKRKETQTNMVGGVGNPWPL